MKKQAIFSLALLVNISFAQQTPISISNDARIQYINYDKNNIVLVNSSTFISTQLVFGEDETIIDIQNGDSSAWTYHVNENIPHILNIKPIIEKSDTNLSVITSDIQQRKRIYHFHIISSKHSDKDHSIYTMRFKYPDKEKRTLDEKLQLMKLHESSRLNVGASPEQYHWNYSFHGDKNITPVHVFDDGTFTYMQLQSHQAVPAVFAVDNAQGKESVVNYRQEGNYLVIQQVSPQFTLRNGEHHVSSVFNNTLINQR